MIAYLQRLGTDLFATETPEAMPEEETVAVETGEQ
jgi:hypothetical protein